VRERGGAILGDHHTLAGGEAVVLDHVRGAERVERLGHLGHAGAHVRHRRGHTGGGHDVLGEGLGALEVRGCGVGSEAGDAGRADGVGHACDQRHLRADDHEVGREFGGQGGDGVRIVRADGPVLRDGRRAGVARSDEEGGGLDVGREGAGDGVLARAGTDDEDPHDVEA